MYEKKIPENLDCGINIANKLLGGKWKACVIDSISRGLKRPSEIHRDIPEAPARVLNMHLKELEDYQLIGKKIYPGFPLKVEYFLTDIGKSALPIIAAMDKWGTTQREHVNRISSELQGEKSLDYI
ncbi:MAG TPA: helix-turn-helix domain-containing protein [Chitinophaga sp.]